MAKRKPKEIICSFCLDTILQKDAYTVVLPMHILEDGSHRDVYYTSSCHKKKCLSDSRILRILEEPKSKITKKE